MCHRKGTERRHPQIPTAKLSFCGAVHLCFLRSAHGSYTNTLYFLSLQNKLSSLQYVHSLTVLQARTWHSVAGSLLCPKAEIKVSAGLCSHLGTAGKLAPKLVLGVTQFLAG